MGKDSYREGRSEPESSGRQPKVTIAGLPRYLAGRAGKPDRPGLNQGFPVTGSRFLASLVVAALGGCASDPSPTAFPTAFARRSCGPTDAPSIAIDLSTVAQQEPIAPPLIRMIVYQSREVAAGRTWTVDQPFTNGAATYCETELTCENAPRASVRLDPTTSAGIVSGEVELRFPQRGVVRGPFRAVWNDRSILCG